MPRLHRDPAIAMPSRTCQTVLSASPKVFRTSSLNGCSSVGMTGIVANAISTPCGNCARNEAGSFLFSSFCRMAPPAVTPQIYVSGLSTHFTECRRAHKAKVSRENVKGHGRRSLRDWDGCQDREEKDDVTNADSTTDDELETDRLGKAAVRMQRRQQADTDNSEHPAHEYWDRVIACLLN